MQDEIQKELAHIEQSHNIKILYAVESGSRAWGFASTNSDWDVRFLYIHPLDWYLQIDEYKDNLEKILPNNIDLAGWELKKALRLFRKSNPPLLEWLQSPMVYAEKYTTASQLRALQQIYFNPKSCLHHYLHMAGGNYRDYLQKEVVRVKKYFYVLRPLLACEWIYHEKTMPPIQFAKLLDTQVKDEALKAEILRLLERKMAGEELDLAPQISILNHFIEQKLAFFNDYVRTLEKSLPPDTNQLNILFKETLQEVWHCF